MFWTQECQRKLEHKLSLDSYLLKPIQRLAKYQLILKVAVTHTRAHARRRRGASSQRPCPQELLKHCDEPQYRAQLQEALDCMLDLLKSVNDSMHQIAIVGYQVAAEPTSSRGAGVKGQSNAPQEAPPGNRCHERPSVKGESRAVDRMSPIPHRQRLERPSIKCHENMKPSANQTCRGAAAPPIYASIPSRVLNSLHFHEGPSNAARRPNGRQYLPSLWAEATRWQQSISVRGFLGVGGLSSPKGPRAT